jgi:hypothetical protein
LPAVRLINGSVSLTRPRLSLYPLMPPFLPAVAQAPFSLGVPPLHSLSIGTTANGFDIPARGWNSFGLQANRAIHPDFFFNQ